MNNALMRRVREGVPAAGRAVLWRMGQSGFLIRTRNTLLCLDIYLSPNPLRAAPCPFEPRELDCAELIYGSHDHPDHIDRQAWPELMHASSRAVAVVPKLLRTRLCRELKLDSGRVVGLEDGETTEIAGVKLTGIASAHERFDLDPQTGLHPYMGVVIETEGLRIYHPGDTCIYEGLANRLRMFSPLDAMLLPINGRDGVRYRNGIAGNMTFQEAADLAGSLCPGLVVPAHYDAFQGNLEDPQKFVDYLTAKYPGQQYWVGEIGESIELAKRRQ